MITHCADHAWLQVVEDHVIRKTADVQFGVMMTARIAVQVPAFPVFERAGRSRRNLGMGSGAVSVTLRGPKLTVEERGFPKASKGAFSNAGPMEQVDRWAGARHSLPANQPGASR